MNINENNIYWLYIYLTNSTFFPTYLHPLFSLVKAHEHVDDVKARCRFVLLMDPSEKCAESLGGEAEEHRGWTHSRTLKQAKLRLINTIKMLLMWTPVFTCRALTTLIWCSSPSAWTQWWNRELMLSWIRWTSSPSTLSNLDSKYSRFTWNQGKVIKELSQNNSLQSTRQECIKKYSTVKRAAAQGVRCVVKYCSCTNSANHTSWSLSQTFTVDYSVPHLIWLYLIYATTSFFLCRPCGFSLWIIKPLVQWFSLNS